MLQMLPGPWTDFWSHWLHISDWCMVHRMHSGRNDQRVTSFLRWFTDWSAYWNHQDHGNPQKVGSHRNEPRLRPQRVLQVSNRQKNLMEKCKSIFILRFLKPKTLCLSILFTTLCNTRLKDGSLPNRHWSTNILMSWETKMSTRIYTQKLR